MFWLGSKAFVAGFFASLGFGVLFNIRGIKLIYAGLAGALGTLVYTLCIGWGYGTIFSNFLAAVCFSICCEVLARVCKTPVTTFLVCALIPLVPGGGMYRMMFAAIQGQIDQALSIGLETLSIAGILVLGILIVSTVAQSYFKIQRMLQKERRSA